MVPSVLQAAVDQAIGDFVQAQLGVTTVRGVVNRVPQPSPNGDSVVFWPLRRPRLSTDQQIVNDVKFTGSVTGTTLTVTAMAYGLISPGNGVQLFGVGVAASTLIQSQLTGAPGGVGTYQVSLSQTIASETLSAGTLGLLQETELVYQLDVHGPNSADNSQTLSTLLWSDFAFVTLSVAAIVSPLYCEDPQMIPFMTGADQYEERWVVDAHFQFNPVVSVPQQYADHVVVTRVPVDAFYAP